MIVMDMDGTLLTSDNTISPKTKEMLLQVQKQGVRLVLASGRSYCKLLEYAKELQMDTYGGYLLEVNGLILYDLSTGERHIRKQMGSREMEEIFTYFRQWDVEIMAQFDDGLFDYNPKSVLQEKASYRREHKLPEDFPWTGGAFALLADNRKGYPHIYYIDSWKEIDRSINKVSCLLCGRDDTGECAGKKGFEGFLLAWAHYTKMAGADASGHYKGQRTSGSYRAAAYPDGKCNGIWGRGK